MDVKKNINCRFAVYLCLYIYSKYMISQHFTYFHQPSFCIFVRQWRCVETHKPQAVVAQILGGKEKLLSLWFTFSEKNPTQAAKKRYLQNSGSFLKEPVAGVILPNGSRHL